MSTCWPSCCDSLAAIGRANTSVPPPGGKGFKNVTGLFGQDCACAPAAHAATSAAMSTLSIAPPPCFVVLLPAQIIASEHLAPGEYAAPRYYSILTPVSLMSLAYFCTSASCSPGNSPCSLLVQRLPTPSSARTSATCIALVDVGVELRTISRGVPAGAWLTPYQLETSKPVMPSWRKVGTLGAAQGASGVRDRQGRAACPPECEASLGGMVSKFIATTPARRSLMASPLPL